MKICCSCNARYADDATYCTHCGTPLEGERKTVVDEQKTRIAEAARSEPAWDGGPVSHHGGCLRILYFLFIGCWLGPIVEAVGMFFLHTIVLYFVGAYILERVPCFLTLRNYRWRPARNQVNIVIRIVYFLVLGLWIGHLITVIAHFLNAILIGLPLGQDLMEKRGAYYSLKRYDGGGGSYGYESKPVIGIIGKTMIAIVLFLIIVPQISIYYKNSPKLQEFVARAEDAANDAVDAVSGMGFGAKHGDGSVKTKCVLLFSSVREGWRDLYSLDPATGELWRITHDRAEDFRPSCTSDGRIIAFLSGTPGNLKAWTLATDGSWKKRVPRCPPLSFLAISPSGSEFAYSRTHGATYVSSHKRKFSGGRIFELVPRETLAQRPVFSPNGKAIAFDWNRDAFTGIFIWRENRNTVVRVSETSKEEGFHCTAPAWSPDGKRLAFVTDRDGNNEIYSARLSWRDLKRHTNHHACDFDPAWSPDGSRIAFVSDRDGNTEIYVLDVETGGIERVTNNHGDDRDPCWQPLRD